MISIEDTQGIFYEKAHYCLDLVASFLIFHLGVLSIAEEDFCLKDYRQIRERATMFYPILMKSYTEKAIQNYVSAIILNYHNDYNRFSETEEIFNEMSSKVIYKKNNSDEKEVWSDPK
jgi:hypothetical protein